MTESTLQTGGEVSLRQPLGASVGGAAPVSPASAPSPALTRILQRIADPDLREQLLTPKGGQFCRAVAAELDFVMESVARNAATMGPAPLVSDVEAEAIIRFLDDHFLIAGHTQEPGQRLTMRIMLTLKGIADQLITLQRSVSQVTHSGTPAG